MLWRVFMRRVVVTSMGAITPIGNNVEELWNGLKNGVNGIDLLKSFDTESFSVKLAAEVKDFSPENYMDKREAKRMDRFCQLALAASNETMNKSGINLDEIDLIISTVNLQLKRKPVIQISPLLVEEDINKLEHFISKGSENYKINISSLFKDDLFSVYLYQQLVLLELMQ